MWLVSVLGACLDVDVKSEFVPTLCAIGCKDKEPQELARERTLSVLFVL